MSNKHVEQNLSLPKMIPTQPGIDLSFTHLQHVVLPLDHLAYTCFNSFFILLNSFSSRVELINNDAWH
jgi:hypothetical protein